MVHAWNGEERLFLLRPNQRLEFKGMRKINAENGESIPLCAGNLAYLDRYAFTDKKTLRWRSRLGGEEFILLCDNIGLKVTTRIAEKLCQLIAEHEWPFLDSLNL